MSQGRIVAQGTVEELSATEVFSLSLVTPDGALAIATLKSLDIDAIQDGKIISAAIPSSLMKPEELSKLLIEAGVGIQAFTLNAPTLEERFVQLTGEGFQVA